MYAPRKFPKNFGVFLPGSSSRHSLKYWQHWRCPANTSWKLWYISSWKFLRHLLDNFSQWLIHNFNRGYFSPSARAQWPKTHLVQDKISGLFTFFVCLKILHYSIFLLNISNLVSFIFYWEIELLERMHRMIHCWLFVCMLLVVGF